MNESKFAKRMNALFYTVTAVSLLGAAVLFLTPHYVAGNVDDACPAGMVKKSYSFQDGQGSLECVKSSYFALQQQAPKILLGVVVGMGLLFCFVMARRPHVFQADNARLRIRAKQ